MDIWKQYTGNCEDSLVSKIMYMEKVLQAYSGWLLCFQSTHRLHFPPSLLKNEVKPAHMIPGLKENPSILEFTIKITSSDSTGNATFKLSKICLLVLNVFCSEGEDLITAWRMPQVKTTAMGHCISA